MEVARRLIALARPAAFAALVFTVVPTRASAQVDSSPERAGRMQALLEAYHRTHGFDGAAAVAHDGEVVYAGAFGQADRTTGTPNQPTTRFRVASITKVFTAVLVLQLVEEGELEFDVPVGRYLPTLREEIGDRVTVRQLLTHRSGLAVEYLPEDADLNRQFTGSELLEAVNRNTEFVNEPGGAYSYSNAGYVILAAVLRSVSRTSYAALLRERILEPLGMSDTGVEDRGTEVVSSLARGYRLRLGTYIHASALDMSSTWGNGGVYSTVFDLLRFDRALREGSLISDGSRALLFGAGESELVASIAVAESPEGYVPEVGRLMWARGANAGGFRTQWTQQLDGGWSVVLLANLDFSPRQEITRGLLEIALGGSPELPEPSAASTMAGWIRSGAADSVAPHLRALRAEDESTAGEALNELYEFGHHLIRAGEEERAVELFAQLDTAYPDIPSIVVSRAYACLSAGRFTEAEAFARRALELEPDQLDALEVLAELGANTPAPPL